jgi:cadmium resistance protein CadD (predicted permease)
MESLVAPVGLAIVAFVSTNIDDLFVLVTFLADRHFTVRDVVIGQYAGMGALYAISGIAALISLVLPAAYVGLLGLVPLAIGINKLRCLFGRDQNENLQSISDAKSRRALTVASVTIANGGDNIAVYTALFASHGISDRLTIGIMSAVMTGVWCLAANWLVNHRRLRGPIRRQAHRIAPFVLIGLGILILIRTGAFSLWRTPKF